MFRKMRRIKQELSDKECVRILKEEYRGFLSVLGDDDYPYVIPMNYVYNKGKIIMHSATEGHKVDAIQKHEKVSFCVLNQGSKVNGEWWYIFKSVVIFGKVEEINDPDEKVSNLRILGDKYFPSKEYTEDEIGKYLKNTLLLEINIEHMTGKTVTEK